MTSAIFYQDVRNLHSVLSTSRNFCIHIQLRRISKQQDGGLSPFLLLQSTRAFKHLLVQELGTFATSHGLPLIKYRLICLLSSECLVLHKKFCSVGVCRWHREWQQVCNRELSLLPKGEIKRTNNPWHAGHVDECLTRKYLDIMVVRAV